MSRRVGPVRLLCLAYSLLAGQAPAQTPLTDPDAHTLRSQLFPDDDDRPPPTRAFRKAQPPSADGLCTSEASSTPATARNLVVVPYSAEPATPTGTVPQVQLALTFALESDALTLQSRRVLDRLAAVMMEAAAADSRFAVAGHTDASGSVDLNNRLSCARSLAVREYLVSRGVLAERLGAYGFGSRRPLPDLRADDPRQRRVEIRRAEP